MLGEEGTVGIAAVLQVQKCISGLADYKPWRSKKNQIDLDLFPGTLLL